MALIKCKECGHEVSDKASACPNCGCPIERVETHQEVLYEENPEKKKSWIWALIVLLLCLIGGGGYYAYTKLVNGGNYKDAIVELTPEFVNAIQQYEKLGAFSEGYAAVCKNGKWGYINVEGKEVIPTTIEATSVGHFSEGLAFVLYWEDNKYAVINTKGEVVFNEEGTVFIDLGNICENGDNLPQYNNGEMTVSVHVGEDIYDGDWKGIIYDTKGNIIGEKDEEVVQGEQNNLYTTFTQANGEQEDYQWYTVGLKDANGGEILPAIYDEISFACSTNGAISNGVVLVRIDEIGDDVVEGLAGEWDSNETKSYYGYADLKGNDTFSNGIKEKCWKSKEEAANKLAQEETEDADTSDWLQGRWVGTDSHSGYPFEMIIEGDNLIQKINGQVCYNGPYQFDGDMLIYNDATDFWAVDKDNQVLTLDGIPMRKVNSSSSENEEASVTNPSQDKEIRIMARLKDLNNQSIELTNELARMRNSGSIDPTRYMYIKQTTLNNKEEQISLARQLGDNQLVYEYQQQKQKLEQAYRMMESGY